ncbi:MAG: nuclear transport factor 2 family protein [Acidobacteriota bacterium]
MSSKVSEIIRRCFRAYETKVRQMVEELLADDFTFTSPDDIGIDKATYFERCWPNSESMKAINVEKIFERDNEAFVRYEGELTTGEKFRNTEYFRIEGTKVKEVQVYYGAKTA